MERVSAAMRAYVETNDTNELIGVLEQLLQENLSIGGFVRNLKLDIKMNHEPNDGVGTYTIWPRMQKVFSSRYANRIDLLLLAVYMNDLALAAFLLGRCGMDPNTSPHMEHRALMHVVAATGNSASMGCLLMQHGADPNLELHGTTPLILAMFSCNTELTRVLLEYGACPNNLGRGGLIGAQITLFDMLGRMDVSIHKIRAMLLQLHQYGMDLTAPITCEGSKFLQTDATSITPLSAAISMLGLRHRLIASMQAHDRHAFVCDEETQCMDFLRSLMYMGGNPVPRDVTAAVCHGHGLALPMVRELLPRVEDPLMQENGDRHTALHHAVSLCRPEIVEELLRSRSKPYAPTGLMPLEVAAYETENWKNSPTEMTAIVTCLVKTATELELINVLGICASRDLYHMVPALLELRTDLGVLLSLPFERSSEPMTHTMLDLTLRMGAVRVYREILKHVRIPSDALSLARMLYNATIGGCGDGVVTALATELRAACAGEQDGAVLRSVSSLVTLTLPLSTWAAISGDFDTIDNCLRIEAEGPLCCAEKCDVADEATAPEGQPVRKSPWSPDFKTSYRDVLQYVQDGQLGALHLVALGATPPGNDAKLAEKVVAFADAGCDLAGQSENLVSPLMIAAYFGVTDALMALLDGGAPVEQRDRAGRSAVWYSVCGGQIRATMELLTRHNTMSSDDGTALLRLALDTYLGTRPPHEDLPGNLRQMAMLMIPQAMQCDAAVRSNAAFAIMKMLAQRYGWKCLEDNIEASGDVKLMGWIGAQRQKEQRRVECERASKKQQQHQRELRQEQERQKQEQERQKEKFRLRNEESERQKLLQVKPKSRRRSTRPRRQPRSSPPSPDTSEEALPERAGRREPGVERAESIATPPSVVVAKEDAQQDPAPLTELEAGILNEAERLTFDYIARMKKSGFLNNKEAKVRRQMVRKFNCMINPTTTYDVAWNGLSCIRDDVANYIAKDVDPPVYAVAPPVM